MRDVISKYLREIGKAMVTDEEKQKDPATFIQNLLALKDKYDKILSHAFLHDKSFKHTINQVSLNLNSLSDSDMNL